LPWQQRSVKGKYKERGRRREGPFCSKEREKVIIVDANVAGCTVDAMTSLLR